MARISASMGVPKFAAAFKGLNKGFSDVGTQAGIFARRVGMIGAAFGAAGYGIFASVKAFTDAGDEAVKAGQKAGVTSSAWQEMAYAADLSGVSSEKLQGAYVKLQKTMVAAANGGKGQVAAFEKLGVELRTTEGLLKANDTVMMELAEAFSKMPDGAEKTALAMEVFGKSGAELIPFLNSGKKGLEDLRREAVELGIVFDSDVSKKSEEFNDNLSRLQYGAKGLVYTLGEAFLPVASKVTAMLTGLIKENKGLLKLKIGEFADKVSASLPKIKEAIPGIITSIKDFAARGLKLVDMLGGFGNVAKIAGAILAGPLVKAIMGLLGPLGMLGKAILTTPLGWIAMAAGGIALLANKLGILKPFIDGVADGFGAFGGAIGEAFQGVIKNITQIFQDMGFAVNEVDGKLDPEAWNRYGQAVGKFAGETLAQALKMLGEVLSVIQKIGIGMGEIAAKFAHGDLDAKEAAQAEIGEYNKKINAAQKSGNKEEAARLIKEKNEYADKTGQNIGQYKHWANQKEKTGEDLSPQKKPTGMGALYASRRRSEPEEGQAVGSFGSYAALAAAQPKMGPAILPAGKAPVVQETKHTEEKVNNVNITVAVPPGSTVQQSGAGGDNVKVSSRQSALGVQNH
jgi:hypothetical protein